MTIQEKYSSYLRRQQAIFGDELFLGSKPDQAITVSSTPPYAAGPLLDYYNAIKDCQQCELGQSRTNFVFGVGNPDADLVFVGEAPGAREDELGEPFVGRSGKLLDQILQAIDLSRKDVFILNVIKCRPPGNRDPLANEVEQCEPYLQQQLKIINPKLIVALGRVAAKTLLRLDDALQHMRTQQYEYAGIEARVTYHPAALLRNPNLKKPAWEDFQAIRDRYRELAGLPPAISPAD
jgi:DNA polymerase